MNNGLAVDLQAIERALDALFDPETGRGLVASGRIKGLACDQGGHVRFAIEAPPQAAAAYEPLRAQAQRLCAGQIGVTKVTAVLTAHSAEPPARPGAVRIRKGDAPAGGEPAARTAPRQAEGLAGVGAVLAIASAKGGVGKSTVAVNLACAFAALGKRTGLLDLDIYGPSTPTLLGLTDAKPEAGADGRLTPVPAYGLKSMSIGYVVDVDAPMIWRGPMATSAVRQMLDDVAWAPLDILVLDLPPGTGDIHLTLAQRLPLDGAVIVSTPQELALADVRRGLAMFARTHVPIFGVIENMAYLPQADGSRLALFGEGGARRTAAAAGAPFLGEIPIDIALRQSCDEGRPLVAAAPSSPVSQTFLTMAAALLDRLDRGAAATPVIKFSD